MFTDIMKEKYFPRLLFSYHKKNIILFVDYIKFDHYFFIDIYFILFFLWFFYFIHYNLI